MTQSPFVKKAINEVLELLDPYSNFGSMVKFYHDSLLVDGEVIDIPGAVHIFGVGKAASFEVDAMKSLILRELGPSRLGKCVAYTKKGDTLESGRVVEMTGSHPLVSEHNIETTIRFIKELESISEEDSLIFMLSGGTSALLELPIEGMSFEELRKAHADLLSSGKNINEMNKARKSLSQVKDGKLLNFIKTKNIIQFITCDIPNECLEDVGSGPLLSSTNRLNHPKTILSQSASILLDKLCSSSERIRGEIYDCLLEDMISDLKLKLPSKHIHISGGEATVRVDSTNGKGGRNTHFVLAFANEIYKNPENRDVHILSIGTDGGDGPTDAAGAYINYDLFASLDASQYLDTFNTYEYFEKAGGLIKTGPTKTNVMDLRFIWRE